MSNIFINNPQVWQVYKPVLKERVLFDEHSLSTRLVQLVVESPDEGLRWQAWVVLRERPHTNLVLIDLIQRCPDPVIQADVWRILQLQDTSIAELLGLIKWCSNQHIREGIWENLSGRNLSIREFIYLIRIVPDVNIRNAAGEKLRRLIGCKVKIDQEQLMQKIAWHVLANPHLLVADKWHDEQAHCLAGWACYLEKAARKIEKKENTEVAGYAALPAYAYLFFQPVEVVIKALYTFIITDQSSH